MGQPSNSIVPPAISQNWSSSLSDQSRQPGSRSAIAGALGERIDPLLEHGGDRFARDAAQAEEIDRPGDLFDAVGRRVIDPQPAVRRNRSAAAPRRGG